ncbi:S-layer homology domain-containing protein [Saccharibacillus brassicae]|nr:S-layer homology domain-containing protein [Saccharibacillus brassicae]
MKKIVSLALSTAMALSMFASVTSAATLTTQEKYNALVTQGIFAGYPDGNAYLDKDMTRAEFAKVVALLTGLETSTTGTNSYQDQNYANAWYKPFVEAVTKAGYMQGTTTGTKKLFNPNGKVTVQEMAATLVRAAKLEVPTTGINNSASAWAKGEVQAAINAGLISGTSNFTAAATRGLLVDTAYSYQTAVVKPAVTSYEVTDNGATVVFTLANGEKVTVKPTTALKPNVATTVTFTYDGKDYSESVTWKVTDATKVDSAAASNLKQVTVMFDGQVDKVSAENVNNYSIPDVTIESAMLSADNRSVTLLLADTANNMLTNNRQTSVKVSNVKQNTGATVISGTVNFTPSDVAVPTITEVNALGTGAVEVMFSEPVVASSITVAGINIDGRAVAANFNYDYDRNSVVIETPLTVGEHTISLSGVRDYSGLVMAPVQRTFTVVADTTAPTIASTTSNDLREVTVTFSEPVRSIASARANNVSTPANVELSGRTAKLTFSSNLSFSANTITLTGVTDYSGNAAQTLTATVTPTLDLTAPTVLGTSVGTANGNYYVDVQFSKAVNVAGTEAGSALNRNNYTLRSTSGAVVTSAGLTSEGHPVVAPATQGTNNRTVRITLGPTTALTATSYTLEVAGVRDVTTAQNILTPYSAQINLTQAAAATLERTWVSGSWVYVQFSGQIATSGTGNALEANKYRLARALQNGTAAGTTILTDRNADVEPVGANTVRIYARNFLNNSGSATILEGQELVASYVGNTSGNFFTTPNTEGRVEARKTITNARESIGANGTPSVGNDRTVAVTFDAPVSGATTNNVTFNYVNAAGVEAVATPSNVVASNSNKTVTVTLPDTVPADFTNGRLVFSTLNDQFGNSAAQTVRVTNAIRPVGTAATVTARTYANSTDTLTVQIPVTRGVYVNGGAESAARLFTLNLGTNTPVKATSVTTANNAVASNTLTVIFNVRDAGAASASAIISFDGTANATTKQIGTSSVVNADDNAALATFSVNATVPARQQ